MTEHCDKNGKPKLLEKCTLPLTGENKVDMVITGNLTIRYFFLERAVFEREGNELVLTEIQKDYTLDQIKACTGFAFK